MWSSARGAVPGVVEVLAVGQPELDFVATAPAEAKVDPWGSTFGPEGVPGSGYGCDRPCGGPDDPDTSWTVHYTMRAALKTYDITNTQDNDNWQNAEMGGATLLEGSPFSVHGRTFEGVPEESNREFCKSEA